MPKNTRAKPREADHRQSDITPRPAVEQGVPSLHKPAQWADAADDGVDAIQADGAREVAADEAQEDEDGRADGACLGRGLGERDGQQTQ